MFENLKFDEKGLIPAVIQDVKKNQVLTLCYMTKEALEKTMREGKVYVFRRSRNELMIKGGTSGHIQIVKSICADCEGKSLLIKIEQKVAGCHAGYFTCYYRKMEKDGSMKVIEKKVFDPDKVYKK
jgi:phosphoribosyl-AMP cyclohydrolase